MDCPLAIAESLKAHLKVYKLRSKVKIKDVTAMYDVLVSGVQDPWHVSTGNGDGNGSSPSEAKMDDGRRKGDHTARFLDPRCSALGTRILRPKDAAEGT